jgi:pyrroline-5-carboxylate reductase
MIEMSINTVAIIGLGQLGRLVAKRCDSEINKLLCSRNPEKASELASTIHKASAVTIDFVKEADAVIFALPANEVKTFYQNHKNYFKPEAWLINPATLVQTSELQQEFSNSKWIGMKILGSVRELENGQRGVLVTNHNVVGSTKILQRLFHPLGDVLAGDENWVTQCNSIATRHALSASMQIEQEMSALSLPSSLTHAAMTLVAKGVLQSYADNTLGHFAKGILDTIKRNK